MPPQAPRKIIVTGATGFIGQNLIPLLIKKNYEVVAIARNLEKAKQFEWYSQVTFIVHDIYKGSIPIEIKKNSGLIHLAWQGLPNYKSSFHLEENLPQNFQFIKSMVESGVRKVLVAGTCFEYGFQEGPLSSTTPAAPSNPYAVAKDTLRQNLEKLREEESYSLIWTRLFYMYGPGQNSKSIIAQLDAAIDDGEEVFNMSGGEQLRDYLPIQSVVEKLLGVFESEDEGIYNICSGKPISIRKLVEERVKERGSSIKLNLGYYPYADYEPMAFWGQ